METVLCAPEKRPCTPKDTILTPGSGYSITPVPKFPDRPGRENRVHFSYASVHTRGYFTTGCNTRGLSLRSHQGVPRRALTRDVRAPKPETGKEIWKYDLA